MTQPRKRSGSSASSGGRATRSRSASAATKPARAASKSDGANRRIPPAQIARSAAEQLAEIAGIEADSISGLERSEGGWLVQVEVVEVPRIPDSTSVLASYLVAVDDNGELQSYRREHRYYRNQAGDV
jgi:Gas vesicle synthesis protein GvpO